MTRGKLIVFEGVDRAGKSTQVRLLGEALQGEGVDVRVMRFPDRATPIGRMIGEYLAGQSEQEDHVIHLLFSANRWEAAASIESSLNSGTTVIIDRYYYSGCVYSAAKSNPTLPLTWARHPEEGLPRPDLAIFLDLSPEEAAKRGGYGEEKYEKVEMQEKVRELFGVLRESKEGEDFVTVDAGSGVEEVSKRVREVVGECMERVDREQAPLRYVKLW